MFDVGEQTIASGVSRNNRGGLARFATESRFCPEATAFAKGLAGTQGGDTTSCPLLLVHFAAMECEKTGSIEGLRCIMVLFSDAKMEIRAKCALLSLFTLGVLTADTIISVHGDPIETGGPTLAPFQDLAASWTSVNSYNGVSIAVNLLGTPAIYSGNAYLTKAIGPGTSLSDEIVEVSFTADLTLFPFRVVSFCFKD